MQAETKMLDTGDGERLAYCHLEGEEPGVLFCPGFHSDMQGDKALALHGWCERHGRQYTRFDYYGHGLSTGSVEKGRIGRWVEDVCRILERVTSGPQIVVGSSMGGWLMLHAALRLPDKVAALLGIAAAPDFSREFLAGKLTASQRRLFSEQGHIDLPSGYPGADHYRIERDFVDSAEPYCLLDAEIPLDLPVRLLHGKQDEDVPWQRSLLLSKRLRGDDVQVHLVEDGGHRLSRPQDIEQLLALLEALLA